MSRRAARLTADSPTGDGFLHADRLPAGRYRLVVTAADERANSTRRAFLLTVLGFKPKFVKRFAAVKEEMRRGVEAYAEDVRTRRFPAAEHTYGIAPEELERLKALLPPERVAAAS